MIDPSTKKELTSIFGANNVSDEKEDLLVYGYDATGEESSPEMVAYPSTAGQISETLKLANKKGFPVTARGAGSGFVGGAIPTHGGLVLVMTRMNKVIDIDEENLTVTVEPGVVTGDLQKAVEEKGLFYPPDPSSLKISTIGGNIAMGAGGPSAVKYGVTRDYVLRLTVALPTGEIVNTGSYAVKSVVGYDLTRLMIGSEGTLGIITQAVLKLLPKPESVRTILAMFATTEDAARSVSAIIKERIIPRTLEFIDKSAIDVVEGFIGFDIPAEASAILLIETDGSFLVTEKELADIETVLKANGVMEVKSANTDDEREKLWSVRRAISPSLLKIRPDKINEDITVPRSRIPELMRRLNELSNESGLPIVNFGHAGDGNIHVNIMADKSDSKERESAKRATDELFKICLELDGTISGEHGVGIAKAEYIESEVGAVGVKLIRKIKETFDPENILNPGKILPEKEAV